MAWRFRGIHQFTAILLLMPVVASAQIQADWAGSNVVMRDRGDAGAAGNYDLITVKDGNVLHTEKLGPVYFYGRSKDSLVTISHEPNAQMQIRIFGLPQGRLIRSFQVPTVFTPPLMQGADNWALVDKDTAYFIAYLGGSDGRIFVKANLLNGDCNLLQIPPPRSSSSNVYRAGDFILATSSRAFEAFGIAQSGFAKTIPMSPRESFSAGRVVFIPRDGLYSWNTPGQFTRIAGESLDPIPEAQRETQIIVRGVFAAQSLLTPENEKTIVVLSGPSLNGDLRDEPIEPALTFAKPSTKSIIATIKLQFTPTRRIFSTAQENIIAVVNSADGSIVKFDCVTHKEVGRIELPPLDGGQRPEHIQVVY